MRNYNPWYEDFCKVCKKWEEDNDRRKAEKKAREEEKQIETERNLVGNA